MVVLIYNGILLAHEEEQNLTICDSMDGLRGYYAKWNMSGRERQLPCDFTYMWKLKKNQWTNKAEKNPHRYREQSDGCQIGGLLWGWVKKVKAFRNTNWQLQNSHKGIKYSIRNIVKNIVMSIYGVRWVKNLSRDHLVSYINVKALCHTSESNIIVNGNHN